MHAWLNQPRESSGGWAEITDDDFDELGYLVDGLIALKCEKDPDGDRPIDFKLINRTKDEPMHFRSVPYTRSDNTEEEILDIVSKHHSNYVVANGFLNTILAVFMDRKRRECKRKQDEETTL